MRSLGLGVVGAVYLVTEDLCVHLASHLAGHGITRSGGFSTVTLEGNYSVLHIWTIGTM